MTQSSSTDTFILWFIPEYCTRQTLPRRVIKYRMFKKLENKDLTYGLIRFGYQNDKQLLFLFYLKHLTILCLFCHPLSVCSLVLFPHNFSAIWPKVAASLWSSLSTTINYHSFLIHALIYFGSFLPTFIACASFWPGLWLFLQELGASGVTSDLCCQTSVCLKLPQMFSHERSTCI